MKISVVFNVWGITLILISLWLKLILWLFSQEPSTLGQCAVLCTFTGIPRVKGTLRTISRTSGPNSEVVFPVLVFNDT